MAFDINRMEIALNQPHIKLPSNLNREEKRKFLTLENYNMINKLFLQLGFIDNQEEQYLKCAITPQIAEQLLALSKGNRSLDRRNIKNFVWKMRQGEFPNVGNCINVDIEGTLTNGHHRLHAVVGANMTVMLPVLINLPLESGKYTDVGKTRSVSDTIKIHSNVDVPYKITSTHTGIITAHTRIFHKGDWHLIMKDISFMESRLNESVEAMQFINENYKTSMPIIKLSTVKAVIFDLYGKVDTDKLKDFTRELTLGITGKTKTESNAALVLREWLTAKLIPECVKLEIASNLGAGNTSSKLATLAIQHAFKAFAQGKDISKIKHGVTRDADGKLVVPEFLY